MIKPCIILVRPQLGENIGMVARAMANFALDDLRLVAPRDGWPNPAAGPAAAGADYVLDKAQVFGSLRQAQADCHLSFATTIRQRGMTKPIVTGREAATQVHGAPGQAAYIFGPERAGLETEDVALASAILTIPVNPGFGSLNLAQAVVLCAYEWFQGQDQTSAVQLDGDPATKEEIDGLVGHMTEALEAKGYFFPADRAPAMQRSVRNLLERPRYTHQEARTLRGIIRALVELPKGR